MQFDIRQQGEVVGKNLNQRYFVWSIFINNDDWSNNFISIEDELYNNYYVIIGIICGMFVILSYLSQKKIKGISEDIVNPLDDLLEKVKSIEEEDLELNVMVNFKGNIFFSFLKILLIYYIF